MGTKGGIRSQILTVLLLSCGAPQPPQAGPTPAYNEDAGTGGDVFDKACATLRRLGCSEGFDRPSEASCADTMRRAETARLAEMRPDCVLRATSVTTARSCGRYCKTVLPDGTQ
jgi:hypothetical protein